MSHGVRACHSTPVCGVENVPFGSLMLCFEEARTPSEWELRLADFGARIAGITFERDRSERVLRESQKRYQALVDASAQIVWTTDPNGEVVEEDSPSWRAFTGQSYDQWKGWGWLDVFHPEDRERVGALWRQAVSEKTAVITEYRMRHISGEWRWTAVRAVPLFGLNDSVRGWV